MATFETSLSDFHKLILKFLKLTLTNFLQNIEFSNDKNFNESSFFMNWTKKLETGLTTNVFTNILKKGP